MSHGITHRDTAWFFNKPAWHGLGEVATEKPRDAQDWLRLAKLDWQVDVDKFLTMGDLERALKGAGQSLTPRQVLNRAREFTVPDLRATVRADTHDVLGVVSDEYVDWQNREVFAFLEAMLGETEPETAFSLHGGKQVGALTRIPDSIEIGGDEVRTYIYARWRHDGNGALWVFPTPVRVVCANTDRAAIDVAGGGDSDVIHKIQHRGDKTTAVHEARTALSITANATKLLKRFGDRLARQKVSERQLAAVLDRLYPAGLGVEGGPNTTRGQKRRQSAQNAVRELHLRGDTQGNSPGTKWCLYNALIERHQHVLAVRTPSDVDDPTRERIGAERRFVRAFEDPDGFGSLALRAVVEA